MMIFSTKINDSLLNIRRDIPKEIAQIYSKLNNYVIMRVAPFWKNSMDNLEEDSGLLITFKKEILNKITPENIGNLNNIEFGEYSIKDSKNKHRFYLPRKKFPLVKKDSETIIFLSYKKKDGEISLNFPETSYYTYLITEIYQPKMAKKLKSKITKGISAYYNFVEEFTRKVKEKRIICKSHEIEDFKSALEDIDLDNVLFSNLKIRTSYFAEIDVIVLKNYDLLIVPRKTFVPDKEITDVLEEEINFIYKRGRSFFNKTYPEDISKGFINQINESIHSVMKKDLKLLKIFGQELFVKDEFIADILLNYSILLDNQKNLKKKFSFIRKNGLDQLIKSLSLYHAFKNHFPLNKLVNPNHGIFFNLFLNKPLTKELEKYEQQFYELIVYSGDIIYLFLTAQELKTLKGTYGDILGKINNLVIHLCFSYAKTIFKLLGIPPNPNLSLSVFTIFIICLDLLDQISISSISRALKKNVSPVTIQRTIKKVIKITKNPNEPEKLKFKDFKVTTLDVKEKLQESLRKFLLDSYLRRIVAEENNLKNKQIINELLIRLQFFNLPAFGNLKKPTLLITNLVQLRESLIKKAPKTVENPKLLEEIIQQIDQYITLKSN